LILEVKNVSKSFRGLRAVKDASFELSDGEINGLIGPNGAGKTTIFNMIAGVYAPDTGSIVFEGKRIDGLRPDQVCNAGIGRTFQIVKPFAGLSVLDNVMVGAFLKERTASAARDHAQSSSPQGSLGAQAEEIGRRDRRETTVDAVDARARSRAATEAEVIGRAFENCGFQGRGAFQGCSTRDSEACTR
jgi:branched-chain amino acid transport system ATP-binding protein